MVIGIISRVSTLVLILVTAGLFLKQASATSFGTAGRDLGSGLSGTAGGITALINSVLNPVVSLFTGFSSLFNFGTTEQSGQSENTYGNVRNIPTPNTSRVTSSTATANTVKSESSTYTGGGYVGAVGVASYLR